MSVTLQILDGSLAGQKRTILLGQRLRVGRTEHADLATSDPTMSAIHFELSLSLDGCVVRDLESANGTRVNGRRVDQATVSERA